MYFKMPLRRNFYMPIFIFTNFFLSQPFCSLSRLEILNLRSAARLNEFPKVRLKKTIAHYNIEPTWIDVILIGVRFELKSVQCSHSSISPDLRVVLIDLSSYSSVQISVQRSVRIQIAFNLDRSQRSI